MANRELFEETGAIKYTIKRSFIFKANGSYAMVYYAEIDQFEELPNSEIACIGLFEKFEFSCTYPKIQPYVMKHFIDFANSHI